MKPDASREERVGVFVGILGKSVEQTAGAKSSNTSQEQISYASGNISFRLALTGPCVSLDTACSSQLVASHYARSALRDKECSDAVAAGVGLLGEACSRSFAAMGMLSLHG